MKELRIFTSESVSEGHPDKLADQISDALLDDCLRQDANARVAIETLLTRGLAVVAGEVTVDGYVDVARIVRNTVNEVGYTDTALGFDGDTCIHGSGPRKHWRPAGTLSHRAAGMVGIRMTSAGPQKSSDRQSSGVLTSRRSPRG